MYSPTYKRTNLAIHFVNLPNKRKKMTTLKIFEFNSFGEHCYVAWDSNDCESNSKLSASAQCDNADNAARDNIAGHNQKKECIIIDPGCYEPQEKDRLFTFLNDNLLTPASVLLTHAHPDHCFGVATVCRKYGVPVYMNENENVTLSVMHKLCLGMGADDVEDFSEYTRYIEDGEVLDLGPFTVTALSTPGHSAGGTSYLVKERTNNKVDIKECRHADDRQHCIKEKTENQADAKDGSKSILFSGDTLFAGCIGRSDLPGGDYDKLMESIFTKLLPLDGDTDVLPGHGHSTTIADERMKNPFLLPFNEPEPGE